MSEQMEYKAAPAEFKATGDAGEYEGHFSVFDVLDDGGDIVHPGAFLKTISERGKRCRVFYAHDWGKLIGPPPDVLQEDSTGLYAKGRLTLDSFWGKEAWALMKDGALTEASFGYSALKWDFEDVEGGQIRHLREVKLYEISPVPLGMNALTTVRAVKAEMLLAAKAAIPPHTSPKADEDADWDAGAVLRQCEGARQLRLVHAWVDSDGDPDVKGSYKLPHHYADGRVVWRGVAAAGAALMGARGGVNIPSGDVPGTKAHLARHYGQFDKTPPWEEEAGARVYIEALEAITRELKKGQVFTTVANDELKQAVGSVTALLDVLNDMVAAAEPRQHSALRLERRLRAAQQALSLATVS